MKQSFWKNLSLALIALLVSLGLGELIIRGFVPVRNVGPSFAEYHPLYGKALKKNFSCQRTTPEFTMKFTTNSDGFRGPVHRPLSHSILFLGDSFTMGYGVNDGDEYPALVHRALNERNPNAFSIINAGMGDNGNGQWVKFLRAEGNKYNPDLVVLQIHDNDFRDNVREQLFEITPEGKLREHTIPPPGARWSIQKVVEGVPGLAYSYLIGFARQAFWDRNLPRSNHNDGSGNRYVINNHEALEDHLLTSIVGEVLRICEEERWKTLALIVGVSGDRLAKLNGLFTARNIPAVTIPAKNERPDLYYRIDGHWNALGHRFAAERIFEQLIGYGDIGPFLIF